MRVAVIGAGMSGLVAARDLSAAGLEAAVFDKGRAVGGRMATKRFAGGRFDHGAQHFSVRDPDFAEYARKLSFRGVVGEWYSGESLTTDRGLEIRHVGVPAMRSICEQIAVGLGVRLDTRIVEVRPGRVTLESGAVEKADAVIVTAPLPQISDLLGGTASPDVVQMLESVEYEACIAMLATLESAADLEDGHLVPASGPIAWIADNYHKGVSPIPAVTIHSTPEYAADRLEADSSTWLSELSAAFESQTGAGVARAMVHRWRYSRPSNPLDVGCLDVGSGVWLAGEAFAGARVEGAFLSGRAVARAVLDSR